MAAMKGNNLQVDARVTKNVRVEYEVDPKVEGVIIPSAFSKC